MILSSAVPIGKKIIARIFYSVFLYLQTARDIITDAEAIKKYSVDSTSLNPEPFSIIILIAPLNLATGLKNAMVCAQ